MNSARRIGLSLATGLMIETAALALAIHLAQSPPATPKPVIISLALVQAPPKPAPAAPKPAAPEPKPEPPKPQPPKPTPAKPQPTIHRALAKPTAKPQPVEPAPTDAPVLPAPKPAPAPQPAPASTISPTEADNFIAAMNAAVQAAVRYPNAARILARTGTTTLSFTDRDGVVSDPQVANSSGSAVLDQAALAALAAAQFPAMPAAMRGKDYRMTIAVDFTLQ